MPGKQPADISAAGCSSPPALQCPGQLDGDENQHLPPPWGGEEKGLVSELKELICFLIIHGEESSRTLGCCWDGKQAPAVSEIFKTFLLWPALLEAFLDWVCASHVVLLSPACHLPCCVPADVTEHCWLLMVGRVTTCFCVFLWFGRAAEISIFPCFMDLPPLLPNGNNIAESACPREGTIWWHSRVAES